MVVNKLVAILVSSLGAEGSRESRTNTTSQGLSKVGQTVSNNLVELLGKNLDSLLFLLWWSLKTLNQFQHVRMASRQTLSNNLERTSHDVGTFDGNGNGQTHVCVSNVILVSTANGRSSGNVHSLLDNTTTTFGTVLLHDGRDDHGSLVIVDNGIHEISSSNANESITTSIDKCCVEKKREMSMSIEYQLQTLASYTYTTTTIHDDVPS